MLYNKTKELLIEIAKFSKNIPKDMVTLKNELQLKLLKIAENIRYYMLNNDSFKFKAKYLKDVIVYLSMVDLILDVFYSNGVLGVNLYKNFGLKLEEIRKLAYGVVASEKKQAQL